MVEQNSNQAKGKKQNSMLDTLLKKWGWNYVQFSKYMGISRFTLIKYRNGERELRLNWEQIKKLELLLDQVEMNFNDLPDNWFRDIEDDN